MAKGGEALHNKLDSIPQCQHWFTNLTQIKMTISFLEQLECGPMPNVMAALPNIGGALCSTPQSLADAHY